VGLANPASVFCIEQGGTLELRNTMEGSVGYCHLPDGTVIEEWELFRAKGPKT
jgi:putative hemolysin